ncbi:MAG: phage minor head protein [Undibacterium sp.]|uniref:phage head morphogenesis protein n=1 Tax=Undibacterium sp. TaxID=1914977 RepID=UPI0027193612|nr:phage minor head protein [Undibacterium sp.]MDO8654200.1 phage minor head protein [Undibacterium sp.]
MKSNDLYAAFNLPPERAMSFLGAKGLQTSGSWTEVWQEAHARAFTVANCHKLDVLQDIHGALNDALKNGTTYAQFQDRLKPLLIEKGWWGKAIDPKTGEILKTYPNSNIPVQYGSPQRLKLIFDTNLRVAYMAGKYQSYARMTDTHPFWQYSAIMDNRTRPAHRSLHGRVFRYDDGIWGTIWPPNGYRCRCTVINLMASDMAAQGLSLSDSTGYTSQVEVPISKRNPDAGTTTVTKLKLPGMDRSFFTDPSWNTNAAKAAYQPQLDKYDYPVARQYVNGALKGPAFERFFAGKSAENFPVAVLKPLEMKALGQATPTLYLSAASRTAQVERHADISIGDYQRIPEMIDLGEFYQLGSDRLVMLEQKGIWHWFSLKWVALGQNRTFLTVGKTLEKNSIAEGWTKLDRRSP